MVTFSIETNIKQVERQLGRFANQIPFAGSMTLNRTMTDVQKYLRTVTFPKAWTNRNKSLAKAATGHRVNATKRKMVATMFPARSKKSGYLAGEGFLDRQFRGNTKTPKNSMIAIPIIKPGLRRLSSGAIAKAKRPRNNAKLFKFTSKNGTKLLVERQRKGKIVPRYVLTPKAKGTKRLVRYHTDVNKVVHRVIGGHWRTAINQAVRTAR